MKPTLKECYNSLWNLNVDERFLSDKGTSHSYIETYDTLLNSYQDKPINFLEIGIGHGSCLEMWTKYFHSDSKIHGFDIEDYQFFKNYGIIHYGDSKSKEVRDHFFKDIMFDLIVEDGDHSISAQIQTFKNYYTKVKKGGLYIIEDIQNLESDLEQFRYNGFDPDEVIDLRNIKDRSDDVIFVFKGGRNLI